MRVVFVSPDLDACVDLAQQVSWPILADDARFTRHLAGDITAAMAVTTDHRPAAMIFDCRTIYGTVLCYTLIKWLHTLPYPLPVLLCLTTPALRHLLRRLPIVAFQDELSVLAVLTEHCQDAVGSTR